MTDRCVPLSHRACSIGRGVLPRECGQIGSLGNENPIRKDLYVARSGPIGRTSHGATIASAAGSPAPMSTKKEIPVPTESLTARTIAEIRSVYSADNRPWVIGYSGGKDST